MNIYLLLIGLLFTGSPIFAQVEPLQTKIGKVIEGKRATVGVGIYDFGSQQTLIINGDQHMPMQSVYKFHVALAMLNEVDKGQFKLTQKMHVKKSDIVAGLHSPMGEAYPNGEVDFSLAEIIR